MRWNPGKTTLMVGALCSWALAGERELEEEFRNPPAACRPAPGWFLSQAFAETASKCPDALKPLFQKLSPDGGAVPNPEELKQQRLPFHVFVADDGPSVTPEEIKRMAIWQAKVCSETRFSSILWLGDEDPDAREASRRRHRRAPLQAGRPGGREVGQVGRP
jgi:hypothetical protein